MIHIGQTIEKELRAQRRTVSWLSRQLFCERPNVYDIFHRQTIDTELLLRISVALGRNFFLLYEQECASALSQKQETHIIKTQL